MKVLLDIKDSKAKSLLEVLRGLPYVKTKSITPHVSEVLEGIRQAVEEMTLVKAGKLKARNAKDLLDEL